MTRETRTTRENTTRKVEYEPVNELSITPEIEAYFNKLGFHLRWVRWSIDNMEDQRNIGKRFREGYEPVELHELPEDVRGDFEVRTLNSRKNQVLCVDDVMLCKIPLDLVESRKSYFENRALDAVGAANRYVDEGLAPDVRRQMPSFNESKSEVVFGTRGRDSRKPSQQTKNKFGGTLPEEDIESPPD